MQHPPKKEKKKLSCRMLFPVFAVFLLLAAAALLVLLPQIQKQHPGKSAPLQIIQPDFRTLEIRDKKELDTITVFPSASDSYTLKVQDGTPYLLSGGESVPVSETYADELMEVFTHIVAQETVTDDASEVAEHLADMGLAPPVAHARIRYQDGSEATIEVGSAVPNTTYAYYRWSGDMGVYMCDVGVAEAFALTANHLLTVSQTEVIPALITELSLTNAYGQSRFQFDELSGRLIEPFAYPLSAEASERLLQSLQGFRLGTRQASLTEENRAFYGFDQPLCTIEFKQQAGYTNQIDPSGALVSVETSAQSVRYVIGRAEGDFFYTCEYEGSCYFVSRFLAEALVNANANGLITLTPAAVDAEHLAALAVHTPKGDVEVEVLRSERVLPNNQLETDEYGRPVYDTLTFINGKQAAPEMLAELCDRLNTLSAAGRIPETFDLEESNALRWSLTLETIDGQKRFIKAYRMDAFSDALMVDGTFWHYVHADAIDVLTSGLL